MRDGDEFSDLLMEFGDSRFFCGQGPGLIPVRLYSPLDSLANQFVFGVDFVEDLQINGLEFFFIGVEIVGRIKRGSDRRPVSRKR